jgi:replicative DNA helicase
MSDLQPIPLRKILPHSLEAEMSVLGAIMLVNACFAEVAGIIQRGDFYHPVHESIFAAMGELDQAGKPIDTVTVADAVGVSELRGMGGTAYLSELVTAVVTVENVAWYARTVRSKAHRRRIIYAAIEVAGNGYGGMEDAEFLDHAEALFYTASQRPATGGLEHVKGALREMHLTLEERVKNRSTVTGVASGWGALDEMTAGFQPQSLVLVAGRPAMGKTAWVLGALGHAAREGIPAAFFSLEMARSELVERMVASDGSVDGTNIRTGRMGSGEWLRLVQSSSRIAETPLWIDDSAGLAVSELRSRARRWRADPKQGGSNDKAIVAVDYLQLAHATTKRKGDNREQEVAEISRSLKALAKELRCPVVALSQLSRRCEERADKRPLLSDLRESGSLEQDADVICFLYRDEVYDPTKNPGVAEVIVAKQRQGRTGNVKLSWRPEFCRFDTREFT